MVQRAAKCNVPCHSIVVIVRANTFTDKFPVPVKSVKISAMKYITCSFLCAHTLSESKGPFRVKIRIGLVNSQANFLWSLPLDG